MDLKGITWVGDVYEKFETMCLEVEETMYEDTVKYVENQVQTVGASMKKFYAEVMQDLLPPGSEDPAKGTTSGRSEELYTDLGIYLKPKVTMKNNFIKFHDKGQLSEPLIKVSAKCPDLPPAFLCHVDNLFPLYQGDSARSVPGKYTKVSLSKKFDVGIIKSSRPESIYQDDMSGFASPVTKSLSRKHSIISHEASFDQLATLASSGSGHISGHDPVEKSNTEVAEPKAAVPVLSAGYMFSDRANALESGNCERLDARLPSSDNPLAESNGIYVSEGESSTNTTALSRKFAYTEDYTSNSGRPSDWDINMIVDDGSTYQDPGNYGQTDQSNLEQSSIDQEMESDQQVDLALLEETCIVVSEDEFDFVSHPKGKGYPYKKRLKHVLRSLRKQQQEKLAELKSVARGSASGATSVGAAKSQALEAEWELI
ncbi:unnamed protein product [Linum trigynum]|uniref:Uncharacterized protein n=1 Tax=Linum trigynum TaxID=586398 RepID=A0AAV2F7E6_9ROSI